MDDENFSRDGNYSENISPDGTYSEEEEKAKLIAQVLELQNTLEDLSTRVDKVGKPFFPLNQNCVSFCFSILSSCALKISLYWVPIHFLFVKDSEGITISTIILQIKT